MNQASQDHMSEEKHPKQDFQVERIAFFSDAVFAIAITLLVIEFKPPIITKSTTSGELWEQLSEMKLKLASLVLSFALIIGYWVRHHILFKHIHNYNKKIVLANMMVLLPIIFFPYTTSFLYENINSGNLLIVIPYRLFLLNLILSGCTMYYFYWTVTRRFKNMAYPMPKEEAAEFERKLIILTASFLLVFILSYLSFKYSYIGIFPVAIYNLYDNWAKKKASIKKDKKITHA